VYLESVSSSLQERFDVSFLRYRYLGVKRERFFIHAVGKVDPYGSVFEVKG